MWPVIVLKEIFLGMAIGFCFGMVFWAIGAAVLAATADGLVAACAGRAG